MNYSSLGRGTVALWSHWHMVTYPVLSLCAQPPPLFVSSFHVERDNWYLLVPASRLVVSSIDSRSPSRHWDERGLGLATQPCSFQKVTHEPHLSLLMMMSLPRNTLYPLWQFKTSPLFKCPSQMIPLALAFCWTFLELSFIHTFHALSYLHCHICSFWLSCCGIFFFLF